MIQNYLTIAFRALWKNKGIATINIVGLSLGLACFSLFLLHVVDEFSFDRFHTKNEQLYRVYVDYFGFADQPENKSVYQPMPLGAAMQADLPDVVHFSRLKGAGEVFVRTSKGVSNENVGYADAPFFEMFSFPLLYGDPANALAAPGNVVLTEKMALKLFGESNPLGKTLEIRLEENFEPFTVSAVTKDLPSNSTIRYNILLPFLKYETTASGKRNEGKWNRSSMQTYVELRPGSGLAQNKEPLSQFWQKYHPDVEKEMRTKGQWTKEGPPAIYGLQALRSMHNDVAFEDTASNPKYAWILLGIGAMILLIACINFTTLAIGRSAGRAREIGVRKVIGASRTQLSRQFMTEALLLSGISTVAGLGLAWALLPVFNELSGKALSFDFQQFPELWWLIPAIAMVVGGLAGAYPAFVLSGFSPVETLKSKFKIGGENWFTRSLVTFQFVLSVGLVACTLIMLRQMDYLQSKNPGFNKDNVVVVNADGVSKPLAVFDRFQQALAGRPEIVGVSGAELSLGADGGWSQTGFDYQGKLKQIYEYYIDPNYVPVLGVQLLAGRNFDRGIYADSVTSVILNEAAVRDFGWTVQGALGQALTGYNEKHPERNPVVIGVVKDYNYLSLHEAVGPMMFQMFNGYLPYQYYVRIAPGDPTEALASIRKAWSGAEAVLPFRYTFLDENLNKFYETEQRWSSIVGIAGGLSIFLACLGLLGLAALAVVNRTKEIGIRKVLGASVAGITGLVASDFVKLVLIAIVIASPLAYYAMSRWLQGFAFHIDIGWWVFVLSGLLAVGVAFLTVGFQSVKAALRNPVKALRSE